MTCKLIGKVGKDIFGEYLINESKRQGVLSEIKKENNSKTGAVILMIDNINGERTMISDRGANLNLSEADITGIEVSDIIYISGYSLFDSSTRSAVEKAKNISLKNGIPIAVDPSSTYFLKSHREYSLNFMRGVTFFFPNYEEGVLLTKESEPDKIISKLKEYVTCPILTLGDKGCVIFNEDIQYFKAPIVNARDTTAAGDYFVGSFLASYWKTNKLKLAAERAIKVSSNTTTYYGTLPEE